MKKRTFIKPIVFILIFFVLFEIAGILLSPRNKAFRNSQLPEDEAANTMDYLIIGDSEACASVCPMEIWNQYGYAGYNMGVAGQYLKYTYSGLESALETQSPSVVLMEANAVFRVSSLRGDAQKAYQKVILRALPLIRWHDRWNNLFSKRNGSDDFAKGFIFNKTMKPCDQPSSSSETTDAAKIGEVETHNLEAILALCQKNGIRLVLYSAPSLKNWTYMKHNAIQSFADTHGITFVDCNLQGESLALDWTTDTRDKGDHVNYYGALKVSAFIGSFLKEQGMLSDKRENPQYQSWNDCLKDYLAYKATSAC